MCFSNVYDSTQNSKLVHSFQSLSLKPMQGNEVEYLTMLAPQIQVVKTTQYTKFSFLCSRQMCNP